MPLKAAAQYVGGLLIATLFVVLLSFTFSFLGTIFCAALAGMMLGALRTHKWHCLPLSLLFPLVIVLVLRGMKSELSERQILAVALACFFVFWFTYVVAAALFFYERKGPPAPSHTIPAGSVSPAPPPGESPANTSPAPRVAVGEPSGCLSLEMLQGNWSREAAAHPEWPRKRLTIQNDKLILSSVDAGGEIRILASTQLKL